MGDDVNESIGTLTPKQKRFLDFILDYTRQHGCNPSQTEIARHFQLSSLGSVQTYIKILEQKGFISREQNAVRGIKVLPKNRMLPLLGKVAAGLPIEHAIHHEEIEVPSTMLADQTERPHFALKVKGDSMKDVGILDGDYIVVRQQPHANNTQLVVAMINGEAVIKRLIKKRNQIELHSENEKYKPILIQPEDDFQILGVFIGLMRMNLA
jgi:repressor LexA